MPTLYGATNLEPIGNMKTCGAITLTTDVSEAELPNNNG